MWSGPKPLAYDLGAARPMRRMIQGRRLRLITRVGAMALAAAVLVGGTLRLAATLTAPQRLLLQSVASESTPPGWSDINHPIALYDLAGTEFAKLPHSLRARRHQPDGAREDILTFGTTGSPRPYLQLSLLRTGPDAGLPGQRGVDPEDPEPLADDLARLAGLTDQSVTAFHDPVPIATRLGTMTVGELQLWNDNVPLSCTGFRGFPGGGDGLRILGFACGAGGRPVGPVNVACMVDRVDLLSAGDDRRLRAIFVAAEREPHSSCAEGRARSAGGLLAALGARTTWLDRDAEIPPLRGVLEASVNKH